MPLQSQQIVSLACQMARVPGFTSQAGQLLNMILSDLCETYDLSLAIKTAPVVLTPSNIIQGGSDFGEDFNTDFAQGSSNLPVLNVTGSGPYKLPEDYLRMAGNSVVYQVDQTPYVMVNIDLSQFDSLVQNAGISNYPQNFATDRALTPPGLYVWPPPSGVFTLQIRYYSAMADITTPETSSNVPWFPNQDYLITRLAGEIMKLSDDERCKGFLDGAKLLISEYLKLQGDDEGRAISVSLDRRRFGGSRLDRVPNTKLSGW